MKINHLEYCWNARKAVIASFIGQNDISSLIMQVEAITKQSMSRCFDRITTEDHVMDFTVNFPKQMEQSKC